MGDALTRDRELTLKIATQVEAMKRYRDSPNLPNLLAVTEQMLGAYHLLVVILQGLYSSTNDEAIQLSSMFLSEEISAKLQESSSSSVTTPQGEEETANGEEVEGTEQALTLVPDGGDGGGSDGDERTASDKEESNNNSETMDEAATVAALGAAAGAGAAATAAAAASTNGQGAAKTGLKYNPLGRTEHNYDSKMYPTA